MRCLMQQDTRGVPGLMTVRPAVDADIADRIRALARVRSDEWEDMQSLT